MADIKKYVWVLPVIVGILAIITLLTPVATLSYMGMMSANLWMWNLYTYNISLVAGADFITEPMVMIPGLIATILIVVGGVGSLGTGIMLRNSDKLRKGIAPSAIMGIMFIISGLLWLILVPTNFPMGNYFPPAPPGGSLTFWAVNLGGIGINLHTVSFGLIGTFITAILAFGGAGAASYYSKERKVKDLEKKEIVPPTKEPTASETSELKFCPECGAEIEDPDIKFCGKCGFEFKTPEIAPL